MHSLFLTFRLNNVICFLIPRREALFALSLLTSDTPTSVKNRYFIPINVYFPSAFITLFEVYYAVEKEKNKKNFLIKKKKKKTFFKQYGI